MLELVMGILMHEVIQHAHGWEHGRLTDCCFQLFKHPIFCEKHQTCLHTEWIQENK